MVLRALLTMDELEPERERAGDVYEEPAPAIEAAAAAERGVDRDRCRALALCLLVCELDDAELDDAVDLPLDRPLDEKLEDVDDVVAPDGEMLRLPCSTLFDGRDGEGCLFSDEDDEEGTIRPP